MKTGGFGTGTKIHYLTDNGRNTLCNAKRRNRSGSQSIGWISESPVDCQKCLAMKTQPKPVIQPNAILEYAMDRLLNAAINEVKADIKIADGDDTFAKILSNQVDWALAEFNRSLDDYVKAERGRSAAQVTVTIDSDGQIWTAESNSSLYHFYLIVDPEKWHIGAVQSVFALNGWHITGPIGLGGLPGHKVEISVTARYCPWVDLPMTVKLVDPLTRKTWAAVSVFGTSVIARRDGFERIIPFWEIAEVLS